MHRLHPVCLLLALAFATPAGAQTFYVATTGSDTTGNGSPATPWRTITHALDNVPDGALVLVRAGRYDGRVRIRGQFAQGVTVRSEEPYRAQLRHTETVVTIYNDNADIEGITLQGFDIAHAGPGALPLVVQVQDGAGTDTSRIRFIDNVMHDSFNNDILKINNGASQVLVRGNLFYNQGSSDEHIDINSVDGVIVEDNVFFNDYAASGRPVPGGGTPDSSSFVVVKDSNGNDDEYLGARNVTIRRNLFLNWIGSTGSNFLLFGEDGTANHEAFDGLVENNLMLGNAGGVMRAAFGIKGSRDIVFRANTVAGDLPSLAFAMRLNREGANPQVDEVSFRNNVWSDPTGSMGSSFGSANDFSDTPPADIADFVIARNLYWNGGAAIPDDPAEEVNPSDDPSALVVDPALPANGGAITPVWNPANGTFGGGHATIREAFLALVESHGRPGAGGGGLGLADPAHVPPDDIRGIARGAPPYDLGAYERDADLPLFADSFEDP